MHASVIIAFYKNLAFLDLILKSLAKQTEQSFEVIIAEDDNSNETKQFLKKQNYTFNIIHCFQENKGFRKNKILNQAILKSSTPYLIFIDGDCVLHPQFVKEHLRHQTQNTALIGRRLMLSEKLTNLILKDKNIGSLNWLNFLKHNCKKLDCAIYFPLLQSKRKAGIWGCNWSVHKRMLLEINGFDEDYTKAAVGEDVDIEWRLRANGAKFKSVKFKAIQYHLYHKPNYNTEDVNHNFELLKKKQQLNNIYCINGVC